MIVEGWIAMAAVAMLVYVVLDGFDLGIGILTIGQRAEGRRQWMALVNTTYDGNESWIMLAAAPLLLGVPGGFDILLPRLTVPVAVMVVSLLTRAVAVTAIRSQRPASDSWPLVFGAGSLAAAFSQGVVVAAIAEQASRNPVAGSGAGPFDFVSWYSVLGGLTAIAVCAVAGAVWATHQGDPAVQRRARRVGALLLPSAAGLVALSASVMTERPVALPSESDGRVVLVGCAVLAGLAVGLGWGSGRRGGWTLALIIVAAEVVVAGVMVRLTLAQALPQSRNAHIGEPTSALYLLLIAIAPCMPVVFFLNGFAVWSFRRKLVARVRRALDLADDATMVPQSPERRGGERVREVSAPLMHGSALALEPR